MNPGAPAAAYLELIAGPAHWPAGKRWHLHKSPLLIGRAAQADIAIDSSYMGRRHAELAWDANARRWRLTDLGSPGGCLVRNERVVGDVPLVDGDLIQLAGDITVAFHEGAPASPIAGLARRGRWLTFNQFAAGFSYALGPDDDVVRVACDEHLRLVRVGADAAGQPGATGNIAEVGVVDAAHHIVDDVAGVLLADVAAATAQQRAALDLRPALAAAKVAVHLGRAGPLEDRTLLTWQGDLIVTSPTLFAGAESLFWQEIVVDALALAGIARVTSSTGSAAATSPGVARHSLLEAELGPELRGMLEAIAREPMARQGIDDDPRRRFLELLDAALAVGGGAPTRDEVRGLLVNLFPDRAELDRRLREDVGVLGYQELAAQIKT